MSRRFHRTYRQLAAGQADGLAAPQGSPITGGAFSLNRGRTVLDGQPRGQAAQTSMLAVRVACSARNYTRVTLESRSPVNFTHQTVRNPERLVVDLEGVELNDVIQRRCHQDQRAGPPIQLIRAGHRPGVVELVISSRPRSPRRCSPSPR